MIVQLPNKGRKSLFKYAQTHEMYIWLSIYIRMWYNWCMQVYQMRFESNAGESCVQKADASSSHFLKSFVSVQITPNTYWHCFQYMMMHEIATTNRNGEKLADASHWSMWNNYQSNDIKMYVSFFGDFLSIFRDPTDFTHTYRLNLYDFEICSGTYVCRWESFFLASCAPRWRSIDHVALKTHHLHFCMYGKLD